MPASKWKLRKKLKPLMRFDVSLIQRRLDGVLLNVDRDLQRMITAATNRHDSEMIRQLTLVNVMNRIASNSYAALCFLMVDEDDSRRQKNFVLITPPVNR